MSYSTMKPIVRIGDEILNERDAGNLRRIVRGEVRFLTARRGSMVRLLRLLEGERPDDDEHDVESVAVQPNESP